MTESETTATQAQYSAFLSHNSQDKPFVEAVNDHLQQAGLTCYLDKDDIKAGDHQYCFTVNLTGSVESKMPRVRR